ncbi:hypothetical protein [Sphingopyxis sp. KK2]|uniref:hypothetical protein n=1 Tax=Sphingopyxis sp. KK2 TaxID=1855727 RepID=UPI001181C34D|nr:hypothetical protein [Sphingopyxis sp. KK2]
MTVRAALALALATALAGGPAAAQSDVAAAPSGPRYQAAYTLAQELRDEKSVMLEVSRAFEGDSLALVAQNPELAEIEKQYPGALAHMFDAARPEVERHIVASLPRLWSAIATLLSAELTSAEIEAARAYYASPSGKNLKAAMLRNYDVTQEIAPLAKNLDAKLEPSMIRRGIESGAQDAFGELSAADKAALMRFAGTPAFAKIRTLNQRLLQISADWSNTADPEFEARMATLMATAMEEFIAGKTP